MEPGAAARRLRLRRFTSYAPPLTSLMEQILLFILLGLGSGALIAGLAVGVVMTYRGSGIINLAIGGYAMLAGYAFWAFNTEPVSASPSRSGRRSSWRCCS